MERTGIVFEALENFCLLILDVVKIKPVLWNASGFNIVPQLKSS
jgi:hypothetical protein